VAVFGHFVTTVVAAEAVAGASFRIFSFGEGVADFAGGGVESILSG
jgi:hypothetical protein